MAIPLRMRMREHDVLSQQSASARYLEYIDEISTHRPTLKKTADMSTPETNQPPEEHSLENGEKEGSSQPQTEGKLSPETTTIDTTNSSIVSASDIRGSVDNTTIEASPEPEEAPSAENGSKDEDKATKAVEEPASNGESNGDAYDDLLGNGQLMKKVCTHLKTRRVNV